MRFLISSLIIAAPLCASWPRVLDSAGLDPAGVTVLEGASAEAVGYGFRPTEARVQVRSVTDRINPKLQIVWEQEVHVPVFDVPAGATVFTREKWTGAPLAAGLRRGGQVVFWTAVPLGEKGYERFPYIPQALIELGMRPRVESRGLWAFFDSSYRLRADTDYLAARWRRGGVAALHIAAWHYWEPDAGRDAWLARLIEACHRHAITTYAWIELPHVSEEFWNRHPEWREQTATGQDAHLDWRKLMNLANPECAEAVNAGLQRLLRRFDWDGVNLGELYFESLEGYLNPARFTPFSDDVRRMFRELQGVDPREIYSPDSQAYHLRDVKPLQRFLEFRAELAGRLQEEWLGRIESVRKEKPWLDVALTHVDDRFDTSMRDLLGADASRLLPVAARHNATFLVEDPATVWHLGPERYEEMARRYAAITPAGSSLGVDVNVVERYQDVYPTRQQTGSELFQLVRAAARWFPRAALYFENSVLDPDWALLAAAASPARSVESTEKRLIVDSPQSVAVAWSGCALVNGAQWRARSAGQLLLPPGRMAVEPCLNAEAPLLLDFSGDLHGVSVVQGRMRIDYESRTRAIAVLPGNPQRVVLLPPGRRTEWID